MVDDVWVTGGGTLQHTLTGLIRGTQYDLQIRAVNAAGDGPWSATATGTPTPVAAQRGPDYDTDDDGLIEVGSLARLDAIRYDLDGDGTPATANASDYAAAFPNAASGMGCPSTGCTGYELTTNLDFDTNGDGRTDVAGDDYWNGGSGWDPIVDSSRDGYQDATFHATFEGNSHVITGLYIDRSGEGNVGFFGQVWGGEIRNLGLEGVVVKGGDNFTGGLVGSISSAASNDSLISGSYVSGSVSGESSVGGLAGFSSNEATINASYVSASVSGNLNIGGLVGTNHSNASITASYATGSVTGSAGYGGGLVGSSQGGSITASYARGSLSGSYMGGLVGVDSGSRGTVTASYWDTETTGRTTSAGGVGKTTSELQSPTGYSGIYADWNVDLDRDGTGDDPWDFGTTSEYPVIDYVPSVPATPLGAPTIGAVTPGPGTLAISWTAPESDGGSAITAYDLRHIVTSADETVDSNWTVVNDVWATGGGTLQYTLTGLTAGTQYDLQIRAVNAGEDGPWSATATGTPATAGTCASGSAVPNAAANPGLVSDCETLLAARDALAGTATSSLNWAADTPMSQWRGVTVAGTPQRVTRLSLLERGLTGNVPAELGDLSNLVRLDLEANQLTGEIPTELGDLSNLESMDLGGNQLTGEIPAELGGLSKLERLYLGGNQLTGEIPTELEDLSKLESLYLGYNQLTGEIPTELGNLSNLGLLHLANNQLTGDIPNELESLSGLSTLYLANNQLTGCIHAVWRAVANNDLDDLGLPYCDVLLSALTVSPGYLVPELDPYHTRYSASVGLSPVTVTVSPTNDHNATIRFLDENDVVLADADRTLAGFQVEFGGGVPAVEIRVVSQDGQATHTYTVTDLGEKYDANDDGAIQREEVISAIADYFDEFITREEVIAVIELYFFS